MANYKVDNKNFLGVNVKVESDNENCLNLNVKTENYKVDNKNCLLEQNPILPSREVKKTCANCGKEFSSKQSLSRHKRNCGRTTLTPCDKCQKQFARIDSLKRHIISCEKRRAKPSSCDTCKKVFRNNWFLRRHLPCKGSVTCPRCHRGFRKLERYQLHYEHCRGGPSIKRETIIPSQVENTQLFKVDNENEAEFSEDERYRVKREDSFVSNSNAHVGNSTRCDDHIIDCDESEAEEESKVVNEIEEIKVYILDDNLLLTDESTESVCDNELENRSKIDANYKSSTDHGSEVESRMKNSSLAYRISSNIKRVFNEEQICDVSTQMSIMTSALENLGLHVQLKDKQKETT